MTPTSDDIVAALRSDEGKTALKVALRETLYEFSRDTLLMLQLLAGLRSAEFLWDNVPLHLGKSHRDLRVGAVEAAPPGGLLIELGVWQGRWINELARTFPDLRFHGLDSFEGLSQGWALQPPGHFSNAGELPSVEPNVTLVKGWFHKSIPPFLGDHPGPISFIHLDCDLYSSAMTALTLVHPRLQVGTTIVIDDFMLEPGFDKAEHKAFFDFVEGYGIEFEYTGYSSEYPACSASVVLTKV
jgi:hypothetical protein